MSKKRQCQGVSGQGEPCKAPPMKGSGYCYFHNPETLEQRRAIGGNTRRGPDKKPVRQSGALDGVERFLAEFTGPGGVAKFLERYYILENGRLIVLEDWQHEILEAVFDTKRSDGRRQYNRALVGLARKNGKSTLAAGVAMYELIVGGVQAMVNHEQPVEVYSVATDKDQAAICFEKARTAMLRSQFRGACKILADSITFEKTGATYKVMSADAPSAYGLNPSLVIFDELSLQPNRDLWDAMSTAFGARPEGMMFAISTAGYDFTGIGKEIYDQLQAGDEAGFLFWVDGPIAEANVASWIDLDQVEAERKRLPGHVFQRLYENRWSKGEGALLSAEVIDQVFQADYSPISKYKKQYYKKLSFIYACDLGLRHDRTASVIGHWSAEENFLVVDRIKLWRPGDFAGGEVLISHVAADIADCHDDFHLTKILCDPWQMKSTLQAMGGYYPIQEFQFTAGSVQKLSQTLFNLIQDGRLRTFEDADFREELNDLQSVETSYGWRLDHKSGKHDDIVMAVGMLACELEEHRPGPPIKMHTLDIPRDFLPGSGRGDHDMRIKEGPGGRIIKTTRAREARLAEKESNWW